MGNIFLHFVQTIDPSREGYVQLREELWKYEPIDAFVLMTRRYVGGHSFMTLSFANLFCKTSGCPTSHALLAFRGSLMSPRNRAFVERHLASCDFCSAELQLLSRYRCEAEEYSFAEMPAQLRRLAETLLKRSAMPFKGLLELAELHQLSH
jgi:hypothetical protein